MYRPPNSNIQDFLSESSFIFAGDVNLNLLDKDSTNVSEHLHLLSVHGQSVNEISINSSRNVFFIGSQHNNVEVHCK